MNLSRVQAAQSSMSRLPDQAPGAGGPAPKRAGAHPLREGSEETRTVASGTQDLGQPGTGERDAIHLGRQHPGGEWVGVTVVDQQWCGRSRRRSDARCPRTPRNSRLDWATDTAPTGQRTTATTSIRKPRN